MAITFDTITDTTTARPAQSIISHIAAAWERSRKRREYRRMLEIEEHLLTDVGLTRNDIRRALIACGGR